MPSKLSIKTADLNSNTQLINVGLRFFSVVIRELVETEEEFGRDVQQVIDTYLKPLDCSQTPRVIRDNKDIIFGNLKKISEFHNT